MKNHIHHINNLLKRNNFPIPSDIKELPSSGSDRLYFRINFRDENIESILAAFNPEINENIAWYSYSVHFKNKGMKVPEIYAKDDSYQYFLLQDLGDQTLFNLLGDISENEKSKYYQYAINELIKFQIEGIQGLDLDVAYPSKTFDKRSILWDLNYFKYYFVKPNKLKFDENKLEDEFILFANLLLKPDQDFFLYRDFQSRNIMIQNNKLWFIDFQGGRKGPLQYDLVSLLYQAKANLTDDFRKEMLTFYLNELEKLMPGKSDEFKKYYNYFIYFRLMQVFGAYGFRGIIQRKGHFLQSIPYAIDNLRSLMMTEELPENFICLKQVFNQIIGLKSLFPGSNITNKLTIHISSFSYLKSGYPTDFSNNGGGFVFDCRALPNPGRIAELRNYNGLEFPIIEYLEEKTEITDFLNHTFSLVERSIDNYLERGFEYLSVNFGCTGGKHRSVYSADKLRKHLARYGNQIDIKITHLEIDG